MWNNTLTDEEQILLILALLNTSYSGSYYFFEKHMENAKQLHEITQSMLMDNNNLMQYEIESLVNSLLRNNHFLLFNMLNKFDEYLNEKIRLSKDFIPSDPHELSNEYHPIITEYLGSCLRHSSKALYSISRLIYIFLEIITMKQKDEYIDIYKIEELQSLEVEFLPRFELSCLSAFAVYWGLNQPLNTSSLGLSLFGELDMNMTISTAAAFNSFAMFFEESNPQYIDCIRKMLSYYTFFLPWEKYNSLPPLMNLLLKYKALDVLKVVIRITKHKISIFNFITLYCNAEANDIQEMQKAISECAGYHRAEDPFYSHTDKLINFLRSVNITVNPDIATYQNPELNYYAISLDISKGINFEGKYLLLTTALWTKTNNEKDHDTFWEQLAELFIKQRLYLRAYQAVSSIKDIKLLRRVLGKLVDVLISDKKLSLVMNEVPLPGLKHEVIKYLRYKAQEQMDDYEQLVRKDELGRVKAVVNYSIILYTFLMESADPLGGAELMLIQHNKLLKHLKRAAEQVDHFYVLLEIQKKSLLLCINGLSLVDEKNAIISIVEDGARKKAKRIQDTVHFDCNN